MFICRFLLIYTKEIQSDEEMMNEMEFGIMERMSITSASHYLAGSLAHEVIRKRIKRFDK